VSAAPDLSVDPRAVMVCKRPVLRRVVFAREPGNCPTLEGQVAYAPGDAIVTGEQGEQWPVARAHFDTNYRPAPQTRPGEDGLYERRATQAHGLELDAPARIDLDQDRGALTAARGDWLIDYGNGDFGVVRADIFARSYEVIG
jgi:hypothetical protein